MHGIIEPLVNPQRGDGDHAVVGLAVPAQPLMAHVRGQCRACGPRCRRSPAPRRRAARSPGPRPQSHPVGIDPFRIPSGTPTIELQPLHRRHGPPRPPARPRPARLRLVPVPRRQQPGQVLPEPRRCASEPNKSSTRAAYPSSGPGAARQGRVASSRTSAHITPLPRHTANLLQS